MDTRQEAKFAIYDILPKERPSIRIVNLYPGRREDPLSCDLEHWILDEAPGTYEALSYCWGTEGFEDSIECNGQVIHLRHNVASALRRLRRPTEPRRLWIDCLSINQSDVSERGQQVSFMWDIFKGAAKVLVWLGEAANDSDDVMEYISGLDPTPVVEYFQNRHRPNVLPPSRVNILEAGDSQWPLSIESFLSRPWFRRVWIQQEATTGRVVEVVCGDKVVEWEQLFSFAWIISYGGSYTPEYARRWSSIRRKSAPATWLVCKIQQYRDPRERPSLLFVLHSARASEATDDRDRIYAVQHLANHGPDTRVILESDYQIGMDELCLSLAKRYIEARGISLVSYAGRILQTGRAIPSWVPDWSYRRNDRIMAFPQWAAGGFRKTRPTVGRRGDRIVLLSQAANIDTVVALAGVSQGLSQEQNDQPWLLHRTLEEISYRLITAEDSYITGEAQIQAYLRTLIADNPKDSMFRGRTTSSQFAEEFLSWRSWLYSDCDHTRLFVNRPLYDVIIERTGTFRRRQFALTEKGYMCLIPAQARQGDQICILPKLHRPMIVRKCDPDDVDDGNECYEFIGECYVHGIMEGQACENADWRDMEFV